IALDLRLLGRHGALGKARRHSLHVADVVVEVPDQLGNFPTVGAATGWQRRTAAAANRKSRQGDKETRRQGDPKSIAVCNHCHLPHFSLSPCLLVCPARGTASKILSNRLATGPGAQGA